MLLFSGKKVVKKKINKFDKMSGLIGKKIGMTSVFSAEGKNIPCTVIEAGPCVVTQIKTVEKDGYAAVQVAYEQFRLPMTTPRKSTPAAV